jgi:hypothetical protein
MVFMASMISSVWPTETLVPTSMLRQIGRGGSGRGGGHRQAGRSGSDRHRHGRGDADVAGDAQAQARAFDLDLGEAGLIEQQGELADERGILTGKLCGCFVVWLARHVL